MFAAMACLVSGLIIFILRRPINKTIVSAHKVQDLADKIEAQTTELSELKIALQAEVNKRKNAELFRGLILESSHDCIKMLDLDANLLFMNKNGQELLEVCDFDAFRGSNWIDFWHGDDKYAAIKAIEDAKAGKVGQFVGYFETIETRKPKWFDVLITVIKDESGITTHLLAISRDISKRKEAEKVLLESEQAAKAKAEEAVRARDEFISIASHELRTPLSAFSLQLQSLEMIFAKEDQTLEKKIDIDSFNIAELKNKISFCVKSAAKMTNLLDELLDMTQINIGKLTINKKSVDLFELTNTAVTRFNLSLDKATKITIKTEGLNSSDLKVIGFWDPIRIEQILINLISNALKYGQGNPIEISVGTDETKKNAILKVKDYGPGIPLDLQPKIFDRFERGAAGTTKIAGLGLGLYIARQIVEAHKGEINLESDGENGSTFIVSIPLTDSADSSSEAVEQSSYYKFQNNLNKSYSKRILIVEDAEENQMLLKIFLINEGYKITTASDGLEALNYLLKSDELPSVIFLDLQMPKMGGPEFIREVEKNPRLAKIPIVVMSAFNEHEVRNMGIGPREIMLKPISAKTLIETTKHYIY